MLGHKEVQSKRAKIPQTMMPRNGSQYTCENHLNRNHNYSSNNKDDQGIDDVDDDDDLETPTSPVNTMLIYSCL